jgi:polysaccharide chain length determinant protein (PEP-CTERM system associated)
MEMNAALAAVSSSTPQTDPEEVRLNTLKDQLAELKARFSNKHPDIIRLKQQIAILEEEARIRAGITQPTGTGPSLAAPKVSSAQIEQTAIDSEIKSLIEALEKVQRDISTYKQRIENVPRRELELTSLTREYAATRDLYASLLKRLGEAGLADSLEEHQKAERFRLLEPAVYPKEPAGPKRAKFILVGFALGLGAAMAGVFLWEVLDSSFHRLDDLKAFTTVRVLGSVSQIITVADRLHERRRLYFGTIALVGGLFMLIGIAYQISTGNDQLVRLLVRPASGIQLR